MQELTPEPFTRTTVMQGSPDGTAVRKVTFAYTDNAGVLRMGSAAPSSWGFIAWTAISGQQAYTGLPSLHQRPDSKVQVAAQNIGTNIWSAAETSAAGGVFEAPSSLGGSMAGPPTGVRLDNGGSPVEVLFAVDADGRLWHYRQAGTAWSWTSLGVAGLAGQVAVVEESDNAVRLVARSTTSTVRTALYYPDGALRCGEWGQWRSLNPDPWTPVERRHRSHRGHDLHWKHAVLRHRLPEPQRRDRSGRAPSGSRCGVAWRRGRRDVVRAPHSAATGRVKS